MCLYHVVATPVADDDRAQITVAGATIELAQGHSGRVEPILMLAVAAANMPVIVTALTVGKRLLSALVRVLCSETLNLDNFASPSKLGRHNHKKTNLCQ